MEYNFLDKVNDGLNGVHHAELLPGFTRELQKKFIKKLARDAGESRFNGIAKKDMPYSLYDDFTNGVLSKDPEYAEKIEQAKKFAENRNKSNAKKFADEIERRVENLPEDAKDAITYAMHNSTPEVGFVGIGENSMKDLTTAHYSPFLDDVIFERSDPTDVWMHEYGHKLDHNYSKSNFDNPLSVKSNFGKAIDTDIGGNMSKIKKNAGGLPTFSDAAKHFMNKYPENYNLHINNGRKWVVNENHVEGLESNLADMMKMNPKYEWDVGDIGGHTMGYRGTHQIDARDKFESYDNYNKFVDKGKFERHIGNAPLSLEGYAEITSLMSTPNGKRWVMENMPNTYKAYMDMNRVGVQKIKDENKDEWLAHYVKDILPDENQNVVRPNGARNVPKRVWNEKDRRADITNDYYAVPDRYGNWHYFGDNYHAADYASKKAVPYLYALDNDGVYNPISSHNDNLGVNLAGVVRDPTKYSKDDIADELRFFKPSMKVVDPKGGVHGFNGWVDVEDFIKKNNNSDYDWSSNVFTQNNGDEYKPVDKTLFDKIMSTIGD